MLNYGVAHEFDGSCFLRFDDTNPETSTREYCDSILKDVSWITGKPIENVNYTSNYFDKLYEYAVFLVKRKRAYAVYRKMCLPVSTRARRENSVRSVRILNSEMWRRISSY